ncbi:MAG: glycosyl hydrolase [Candidatus Izimaplasma sp.]|nr:glycosyl hydrolase [Candidatus Izimaplasma bacterium]
MKRFKYNSAINYSGYRENQSPLEKTYPSKSEILEDLRLLEGEFYYLRIYDCSLQAYRVLELITEHDLDFKVMLGLSLRAEINHENHDYFPKHSAEELKKNKTTNEELIKEIIQLGNKYKSIVSAVSVGNETRSPWNNKRVSVQRLVDAATKIKQQTDLLVTFCEEYQTWINDLAPLAKVVDFISLHTYPVWQGYSIDEALDIAVKNYREVQEAYPSKDCIITETGWPTSSHGNKIKREYATVENQKKFNKQIIDWAEEESVVVYLFEAFDEPWKGGDNKDEPEKHWGIYYVNRTRK